MRDVCVFSKKIGRANSININNDNLTIIVVFFYIKELNKAIST